MPQVEIDRITINYDVQGEGEPLLLIPYLSADHACYAFQLPAYGEHFTCIAIDLPGAGDSDKPPGRTPPTTTPIRSPRFWARSGWSARTSQAFRSVERLAFTWPPDIPNGCGRSRSTAAGLPATTT